MSPSNSSSPKLDQKLKTIVVAVEERRRTNNLKHRSPQEVVSEKAITEAVSVKTTTERSSVGLGVVRAENNTMEKRKPRRLLTLRCHICGGIFSTYYSLHKHQQIHVDGKELEKGLQKMGTSTTSIDALSNDKDLGSNVRSTTSPSLNGVSVDHPYRSFVRDTSYNHHTLSPANDLAHSFGRSSSGYPSLFSGGITMVPPSTPHRSFTENTSYGSSSRDILPSYSYKAHGSSLELFLDPPGSNNKNKSSHGSSSLHRSLAKAIRAVINNKSSVYPSSNLNGGVTTGGGTTDLNMPLRPRVSRYYFHGSNPLDSITRSVSLSHPPPPPTTNVSNDSITTSVPLPPPPTANVSNVEKVQGSSFLEKLMSKGKNKIGDCRW